MNRPVVCSFESRRSDEMTSLIERHGGVALSAPSMREVPLEDNPDVVDWIRQFIADQYDLLVLLTGVGTEALLELARSVGLEDDLKAAMSRHCLVIRGPKPAAVLQKNGLRYDLKAPEPNTWRELVAALDQAATSDPTKFGLSNRRVAVQEYGIANQKLYAELAQRGALVTPVTVYRWALPEDIRPLEEGIRKVVAGETDVLLFTSANQLSSVRQVADRLGLGEMFRTAAASQLVASIGPTCSEALQDEGFPVHFEASPPKMGQLVRGAIELWNSRPSPNPPATGAA